MILAACIGCGRAWPQQVTCRHELGHWLRLAAPEGLGVCRLCPGFVPVWETSNLTAALVERALEAAPDQDELAAKLDAEKLSRRVNAKIQWFALNSQMEKP